MKRVTTPKTIDADLSDWGDARWLSLDQPFMSPTPTNGTPDGDAVLNEGSAYAVEWDRDSDTLYIAAKVYDPQIVASNYFGWNQQDYIEICLQATTNTTAVSWPPPGQNSTLDFGASYDLDPDWNLGQSLKIGASTNDAEPWALWIWTDSSNRVEYLFPEYAARVEDPDQDDDGIIYYEAKVKPFEYFSLSHPSSNVVRDLDNGVLLRVEVVAVEKHTPSGEDTGFGELANNSWNGKFYRGSNLQLWKLDPDIRMGNAAISGSDLLVSVTNLTAGKTNLLQRNFNVGTTNWITVREFTASGVLSNLTATISNEWDQVYFRLIEP